MNCPKCGAALAPGSKFCVTCGTPVPTQSSLDPQYQAPQQAEYAQPQAYVQQPAPEQTGSKFDFKQVLAQLTLMFKPLWTKIKPITTDKKKMGIIAGGFALIVVLAILCGVLTSGNGYIQAKQYINVFSTGEEEYSVTVNNKVLKKTISSEKGIDEIAYSIDGKYAAILTGDGELYGVAGKKLTKLADDVTSFQISVDGKFVAFATLDEDERGLSITKINKAKATEITDSLGGSYAIAPDGKAVAFFEQDEDTTELKLFRGKKSVKLTDDEGASLQGLSNGGKKVYVSIRGEESNVLYAYSRNGNRNKLSSFGGGVQFNADHSQIMFKNDEGKIYISTNGKAPKKVTSESLSLVIPSTSYGTYSVADSKTNPVKNLYNHVYTCGDKVMVIKKNSDKNVKLLSNVSKVTLDDSAEYIYYVKSGELRVSKVKAGEKASESYKMLVDDTVTNYVVTSNRKKVYFVDDHETLYSCNGKKRSTPKEIADEVGYSLVRSAKDFVYFTSDGDLYASKNGKKGSKVLGDCEGVLGAPNGIVFAASDDNLYCSAGSKKPKKILSMG